MGRVKEYYLGIIDNEKEENVEFLVDPSIYEIEIDLDSMSIPTYTGKSTGENDEDYEKLLKALKDYDDDPQAKMIERIHDMCSHYLLVDECAWKMTEYIMFGKGENERYSPYVRALEVFMSLDKDIHRAIRRAQYAYYGETTDPKYGFTEIKRAMNSFYGFNPMSHDKIGEIDKLLDEILTQDIIDELRDLKKRDD